MVHIVRLFLALLMVYGAALGAVCAGELLMGRGPTAMGRLLLRVPPAALCVLGLLCALVDRLDYPDSVHLFWLTQLPLVGVFVCSGGLLWGTWSRDAGAFQTAALTRGRWARWLPRGAWSYLLMTGLLALLALALVVLLPRGDQAALRAKYPGQGPLGDLGQLLLWGFGGARPEMLTPTNAAQVARGLGHPQRYVTVPMGATLIAAWLWIAFCVIAFTGRLVRREALRAAFYLMAPPVLAGLCFLAASQVSGPWLWGLFDPRYFANERATGIWKSDPIVLRTYGPVLLVALLGALAIAVTQWRDRARGGEPGALR